MNFDQKFLREVQETRLLIDRLDSWLFNIIEPYIGERILEVGCGMGNYVQHLVDRNFVIGIDISPECVEFVNDEYRNYDSIQAIECDVNSPDFLKLRSYSIDTILSVNVLEHIENDLHALSQISKILTDNGKLILVVPAHKKLFGTMDRSLGHYRRYTKKDLKEKLKIFGFRQILNQYINPLGAFGWLLNGKVLKRKTPPSGQLKIFNYLMPIVEILDRIHLPFGLSVLSVSEKN